jgi:hypothetical protein
MYVVATEIVHYMMDMNEDLLSLIIALGGLTD